MIVLRTTATVLIAASVCISTATLASASDIKADKSVRDAAVSRMQAKLGALRGTVAGDQSGVFLTRRALERQVSRDKWPTVRFPSIDILDVEPTGSTAKKKKPVPIVMNNIGGIDMMTTGSIAPIREATVDRSKTTLLIDGEQKLEIILSENQIKWPTPSLPSISFDPVIKLPKTLSKMWRRNNGPSIVVPLNEDVSDYPVQG